MKKTFANYDHCLTTFMNTIETSLGLEVNHEILDNLNRKLKQKKYQNIVVINVRGMGANFLKRNLKDNSFLRNNKIDELSSVFPASNYASNMTLRTGLNPIEHGVINEDISLDKLDSIDEEIIVNKLNERKTVRAYEFSRDYGKKYKDLDDLLTKIKTLLEKKGNKYIYADYKELDDIIVKFGYDSKEAIKELKSIETKIEKFTKKLSDTVVFVVSNHGYLEAKPLILSLYREIYNMLEKEALVEQRCCHFFIKDGKKLDFEQSFVRYFANDFILISKNEAKSKDVFGTGTDHSLLEDPVGDYIAVAISDKYFAKADDEVKAMPAGITEEEMFVPLIMIDKK